MIISNRKLTRDRIINRNSQKKPFFRRALSYPAPESELEAEADPGRSLAGASSSKDPGGVNGPSGNSGSTGTGKKEGKEKTKAEPLGYGKSTTDRDKPWAES